MGKTKYFRFCNIHMKWISIVPLFKLLLMLLLALTLAACGGVHTAVVTEPDNIDVLKEITLLPPDVTSVELGRNERASNAYLKSLAVSELQALLNTKRIVLSDKSKATLGCRINVDYGNRNLRYIVGFGAGAGHITIEIELKDGTGVTRYATKSEADLSFGAFGGDMSDVSIIALQDAFKAFGTKLP
jgi:hypothetical protein